MADGKKSEHPEWEAMFEEALKGTDGQSDIEPKAEEKQAEAKEVLEGEAGANGEAEAEAEVMSGPADGTEGMSEETPAEPVERAEATEQDEPAEPKQEEAKTEPEPTAEEPAEVDKEGTKDTGTETEDTEEPKESTEEPKEKAEVKDEIKITAQVHEDNGEVHQAKQAKAEKRKFNIPKKWLRELASVGVGVAAGVVLCMAVIGTSNRGKLIDVEDLPTVTAPAVTPNVSLGNPELVVNIAQKSRSLGPKGVDTMYGMLGDDIVIDWYNHTFKETFGKYGWKVDHSASGPVTLKKRGCNAVVTLGYDLAAGKNAEDRIGELAYQKYIIEVKEEHWRDEDYYDDISWRGVHLGDSVETVKERMYDSEYVELNPNDKIESWTEDDNSIFDHETLSSGLEKYYYGYQGKRLAFTFVRDRLIRVYVEVPYQPLEGLGSGYGDSFGALRELSDMPFAPWDNSLDNTFCAIGFGSAWEKAVADGTSNKFNQIGWWDLPDSKEYPGTHVSVLGLRAGYTERFSSYKISRDNVAVTTVPNIHWRGLTWVNGESDFLRMYGDAISATTDSDTGYRHLIFSPYEGTGLHVWFSKDQVVAVQTNKTKQYTEEEWATFAKSYTGLE